MAATSALAILLPFILMFLVRMLHRGMARAAPLAGPPVDGFAVPAEPNINQLAPEDNLKASVVDVKMPLAGGEPKLSEHERALEGIENLKGNVLEVCSTGLDSKAKFNIILRMAQLIQFLHCQSDNIHANISPGMFGVEGGYVTLFDAGLYTAAQEGLQFIHIGPTHSYKSRAELEQDPFVPVKAMDVFGWARTVLSVYAGSHLKSAYCRPIPLPPQHPDMPDALWAMLQKCLLEDLSAEMPSMDDIVKELTAIASTRLGIAVPCVDTPTVFLGQHSIVNTAL